jgi:hypothetical protein
MMVPIPGDPDIQGYRCPTVACPFESSTEADVRTHCLEDCEDKDAYNRKYDQDRASRAESITTKDSGGPNDGTLQPRSEEEDNLIRSIVAFGTDPLFRLAELDPVLHFITCVIKIDSSFTGTVCRGSVHLDQSCRTARFKSSIESTQGHVYYVRFIR